MPAKQMSSTEEKKPQGGLPESMGCVYLGKAWLYVVLQSSYIMCHYSFIPFLLPILCAFFLKQKD